MNLSVALPAAADPADSAARLRAHLHRALPAPENQVTLRAAAPTATEMGVQAVVEVIFGSSGFTALVAALGSWWRSRRHDVEVTLGGPDGQYLKVSVRGVDDPERFLRQVIGEWNGLEDHRVLPPPTR
ncbi:MAG: effector-associated constant component EACC1 [Mycobacteriales bacterium]